MKITTRIGTGVVSAALFAALFGCAQPPGGSTIPSRATAARTVAEFSFRVFTAGKTPGLPVTAVPRDIAIDRTGTVWFTDISTPAIGRISTDAKVTEFSTGLRGESFPYSIVPGPAGAMWFSDGAGAVGRVALDGAITKFRTPFAAQESPAGITVGTDGNIWTIVLGLPGKVSHLIRITPFGAMSSVVIPSRFIPDGSLQADNRGNLWFFASQDNGSVVLVQFTPQAALIAHAFGLITKAEPCCPNLAPKHIAIGPDGNPWFTTPYFGLADKYGQFVGTYGPTAAALFSVLTVGYPAYPSGITNANGTLWFSGSDPLGANGALWMMTATGVQTAFPVPYDPAGLTAAGPGKLWFTGQIPGEAPQIVEASLR